MADAEPRPGPDFHRFTHDSASAAASPAFSEKTKAFEFAPLVCPTTLQDESLSSEAKAIASSVAEHHIPQINTEVDKLQALIR